MNGFRVLAQQWNLPLGVHTPVYNDECEYFRIATSGLEQLGLFVSKDAEGYLAESRYIDGYWFLDMNNSVRLCIQEQSKINLLREKWGLDYE